MNTDRRQSIRGQQKAGVHHHHRRLLTAQVCARRFRFLFLARYGHVVNGLIFTQRHDQVMEIRFSRRRNRRPPL